MPCVVRRFYRGHDARDLVDSRVTATDEVLIANLAQRYVLLGDVDLHNPGNCLFGTERSRFTGGATLLNIDMEDVMPDARSLESFIDSDVAPGAPIPGSPEWRREVVENIGAEDFFRRFATSENALMKALSLRHDVDELARLRVPTIVVERASDAQPHLEALLRTFDICDEDDLAYRCTSLHRVLDVWRKEPPTTLFELITQVKLVE